MPGPVPSAEHAEAQPPPVTVAGPVSTDEEAQNLVQMALVHSWGLHFRRVARGFRSHRR